MYIWLQRLLLNLSLSPRREAVNVSRFLLLAVLYFMYVEARLVYQRGYGTSCYQHECVLNNVETSYHVL